MNDWLLFDIWKCFKHVKSLQKKTLNVIFTFDHFNNCVYFISKKEIDPHFFYMLEIASKFVGL